MKRLDAPPPRFLVLRDTGGLCDTILRVTGSNRGEPYRDTLLVTIEEASGTYGTATHLASVELEPAEEQELRELLNIRAAAALRHLAPAAMPADVPREVLIWDGDRIMVTDVTESTGHERLAQLAQRSPHNTFHLLMSVAVAKGGDVRAPWQPPDTSTERDAALARVRDVSDVYEATALELELGHQHLDGAGIPRERDGRRLTIAARIFELHWRKGEPAADPRTVGVERES